MDIIITSLLAGVVGGCFGVMISHSIREKDGVLLTLAIIGMLSFFTFIYAKTASVREKTTNRIESALVEQGLAKQEIENGKIVTVYGCQKCKGEKQ